MNGGTDSTDHQTLPGHRSGRHRRGHGAGGWTPAVPAQSRGGRHVAPDDPLEATIRGSFPVAFLRDGYADHPHTTTEPHRHGGHHSISGELPVAPQARLAPLVPSAVIGRPVGGEDTAGHDRVLADPTNPTEPTEPIDTADLADRDPDRPTVRRTRITLTAPPEPPAYAEVDEDDARVYAAPVPDGLSTFDLGTVPASVTPPKSWRKAAWFATVSSGGVVVALLLAGSLLVEPPGNPHSQAINGWTERGGQPLLEGEELADESDTIRRSPESGTSSPADADPTTDWSPLPGSPGPRASSSAPVARTPGPSAAPSPTSEQRAKPRKPPPTKAKRAYAPPKHFMSMDPKTMADRSEFYLNEVTENPAAAHEVTTGELAAGGPEGLRRRHGHVAYYEVKEIYVDPNEGYTVNTVEVTHPDGSKSTQRRTLVFGDDTKIQRDGG
ncbi:hypothetical protein SAMN05421810_105326 [Amycolatopsis arida]|uniref:Uncharacterized protein n=1 Tax=Amycolatopsis arida TaxID=587909 RepID=A0A1I5WY03_9PSEU|nr:hypothetical protein [Amycolatopsis arida]TDX92500.1 hypothetical protein CLV69_105345 [Amycolatopsis arida]SFQ24397.1 hypothetical protein SAMN05421810_105326 [Amycolatopsis arida]